MVQSPSQKDPLEEDMAIHSSIFAWRIPDGEIPWTEESLDRGAWWATVHGVAESDVTDHVHISGRR